MMETKGLDDIIKPKAPVLPDPSYGDVVTDRADTQARQDRYNKWGYRTPARSRTPTTAPAAAPPAHRPPYWMRAKNPENQKYMGMPWSKVLTNAVVNLPENTNTLLGDMFKGLYQIGAGIAKAGWGWQQGKDVRAIHQDLQENYPALPGLVSMIGGGVYKLSHVDYAFRAVRALADDKNVTTQDVIEAMKEPVVQTVLFDTMLKIYQDNWGLGPDGVAGLKRYVAENPADFLGDIATVATLGASGASQAAKAGKLAIRSKHLQKFKFNDFYNRHIAGHARGTRWEHGLRRSANQLQDFYENLPLNLDKFSAKAKYIGTGVADGNYPPGFWAQMAHYALTYIDVGALPFTIPGVVMGRLNILGTGALSKVAPEDPRVEKLAAELFQEFHADEFGKPRKTQYTFDETARVGKAVLGYDTYNARVPIEYLKVGPDDYRAFVYTGNDLESLDTHLKALDAHREATRQWNIRVSQDDFYSDDAYARGEADIREKIPEESHNVLRDHFTPIEDLSDDELVKLGIQRMDTKNALDQFLSNIIPEDYLPYPDRPNPAIVRHQQLLEAIRLTQEGVRKRLIKSKDGVDLENTAIKLSQEASDNIVHQFQQKYQTLGLDWIPLHSGLVNTTAVLRDALQNVDADFLEFVGWGAYAQKFRNAPDEAAQLEIIKTLEEDDWQSKLASIPAVQDARAQSLSAQAKLKGEMQTFFNQAAREGITEDRFRAELQRYLGGYAAIKDAGAGGLRDIDELMEFRDKLLRHAAKRGRTDNKFFLRLNHALNLDYFRNIREGIARGSGQFSHTTGDLLWGDRIGEKGLYDTLADYLRRDRHYGDPDDILDLYANRYYAPWAAGDIDAEFLDEVYGLSRHDVDEAFAYYEQGQTELHEYYTDLRERAGEESDRSRRDQALRDADRFFSTVDDRMAERRADADILRAQLDDPTFYNKQTDEFLADVDAHEKAYYKAQENIEDAYASVVVDAIRAIDKDYDSNLEGIIVHTFMNTAIDPLPILNQLDDASQDKVRKLLFDRVLIQSGLEEVDFYDNDIYWRVANVNEPHENFFTHRGEDIELGRIFTNLDLVQNPKLDNQIRKQVLRDLDHRLDDYAEKGFIRDPDVPDEYFDEDGAFIEEDLDEDLWEDDLDFDDEDGYYNQPEERVAITPEFKRHLLQLAKEGKWDELSEIFGQPAETVRVEITPNIDPELQGFRKIRTYRDGKYSVKSYEEAQAVVEGGNFVPPMKDPFADDFKDEVGRDPYNRQVLTMFRGKETGGTGNPYWAHHFEHALQIYDAAEVIAKPTEFIGYYDKDKWLAAQGRRAVLPFIPHEGLLSSFRFLDTHGNMEKLFGEEFIEQLGKLSDLSDNYPRMTADNYESAHRFIRDSLTNGTPAFLAVQGLVDSQTFLNNGDRFLDSLDVIFQTIGPTHASTFLGSAAGIEMLLQGVPEARRGQVRQWVAEYRRGTRRIARAQEAEEKERESTPKPTLQYAPNPNRSALDRLSR